MVINTIRRYNNLFRHIQNWPVYFTRKFKKGFQPLRFVTKGNKLKFIVPSKALYLVFKEIFVTDFYAIDKLVAALPPNPVVIDIGANAGYFDIMLFSQIKEGTVYAYEPIPSNYDLFKKNISLNPALQNNIHLFNKAVTGIPQDHIELFMESAADNSVIASVYADFDTQNHHTLKVPAISLAQIINENTLPHIDLIKVDCEGSEYPIIYETPDDVWNIINMMTIEVHNLDKEKRNTDFLRQFLEGKKFSVAIAFAHSNCYTLSAIKKHG
jgi:FkbM family methyltransferase